MTGDDQVVFDGDGVLVDSERLAVPGLVAQS
jgi:hypothetical protein